MDMNDIRGVLPQRPDKFMHQLRAFIRSRNLAYKTENTYCLWVKRYIFYHNKQHPKNMNTFHVEQFFHHLVVVENVSIETKKVALNALVFLHNQFLNQSLGTIHITKAKI